MSRLSIHLAVLGVVACSVTVSAQHARPAGGTLDTGTRVRVTVASSLHPTTGVVIAHSADTLVVRADADGSTMIVPLGQVIALDVSRGARTSTRRGAFVGFSSGALVGMVVGAMTYRKADCSNSFTCLDLGPAADMAVGGGVGGLAGLAVGALIGSRSIEIWQHVPVARDGGAHVGVVPRTTGGAVLTVSLAF